MDAFRFDHLTRAVSAAGTRRWLLGLLATLPLLGSLLAGLDPATAERKRRRKQRHQKDRDRELHAQKKKKKKCKSPPIARTCLNKCGPVKNKCKKTVNCPCLCDPECVVCAICQAGPNGVGTCVRDPKQQGDACGTPGQICQNDGSCNCDAQSCSNPTPLCVIDSCVACSASLLCPDGQCCNGGSCVASCPLNETCDAGVCTCQCSLGCTANAVQNAIDNANAGDTITLCPGTFGPITIDKDLILVGAGANTNPANNTILDANGNGSVVTVAANATVTLEKVRITGGNAADRGGGIVNNGALTLTECEVTGNTATAFGGGISNSAPTSTLTLDGSGVIDNEAISGGGIFSNGSVTLSNGSIIANNTARDDGGGVFVFGGTLTLNTNSSVSGNEAGGDGGGIFNDAAGDVILNDTSFVANNTAGDDGGGIFTGDDTAGFVCTLTLNGTSSVGSNTADGDGGGIFINSGAVTLNNQSGVGPSNSASSGGGVFKAAGDLTLNNESSVKGNTATAVGGIRSVSGNESLGGSSQVCDNEPPVPQCDGVDDPLGRCQSLCLGT
jgi:hypothetical protein